MKALLAGLLLLLPSASPAAIDLSRLARLTADSERHEGRFVQDKYLASVDASLRSSGRYSYERGNLLRWRIEEPVSSELLLTAEGVVSNGSGDEAPWLETSGNPTAAAMGRVLFAVLIADWEQLSEYFELDGDLAGERWHVVLTPRDAILGEVFSSIELRGEKRPEEILLHETGGNRTRILLE